MTSTARIHVSQAKPGDVRILPDIPVTRRTIKSVETLEDGTIALDYTQPGSSANLAPNKTITIELPDAHPIAVLERLRDRVEEQRKANHQEFLEAVRTGDEGRKIRRDADAKLLQGKLWGLGYAIMELRAGLEVFA